MTVSHGMASMEQVRVPVHHLRPRTKAGAARKERVPLGDRIPTMGYAEMLELCKANGLRFKEQAQNQGILVMRARNALYCALRENRTLREP